MSRSPFAHAWPLLACVVACGSAGTTTPPEQAGAEPTIPPELTKNRYFLRIDDEPVPPLHLELDKERALALFGEAGARRIEVLRMDMEPILRNVLDAIRDACGPGWRLDQADPGYDCSATTLGRTLGPIWRTSPEFSVTRLLGMTPANAALQGTPLRDFAKLFAQNHELLRVDFADLMSDSLGVGRTTPLAPNDALVAALKEQLLDPHPTIAAGQGRLPVSMLDALLDLTTLPGKLGAAGAHPGFLVPDDASFTTRGDVLSPDFRMRVVAQSNLRLVQGIALASGAGEMFVSTARAPLAFDFTDPQRLAVTGIVEHPTVDMRLTLHERPGLAPARSWFLESIVARTARLAYGARVFDHCYAILGAGCLGGVSIGAPGNPPGWTVFISDFKSLSVPAPQALWELLTDVAQVVLHDPTGDGNPDLPEGTVNPVFALRGVPVGLTGAELVAAMRPTLQAQADLIASIVAGRYWQDGDRLDFDYRRPAPGEPPCLFFVDETDRRPSRADPAEPAPYSYDRPGFFRSADLAETSRVSSKIMSGVADTTHEKLRLPEGETLVYAQDDRRRVYAIRFHVPPGADPVEMTVQVNGPREP